MPTRGRPERPRSSNEPSAIVYGQGTERGVDFGLGISVGGATVTEFGLGVGVSEQKTVQFGIGVGAARQQQRQFGLGAGVMDRSGDTRTLDLFGIAISVGESAGYAAPPRIALPNALSLGQEVRRRGEPIPTID